MMPRRLPLRPDTYKFEYAKPADVGLARKTFALVLHTTCLGLFGILVVWPLVSSITSGELVREFKPVLQALQGLAAPQ